MEHKTRYIVEAHDGDEIRDVCKNRESFSVLYCEGCNHAWEMDGKTINYHTDYPSYGLDRGTCINCN